MLISILTPSFGQLDWLRLCIASVADQVAPKAGGWKIEDGRLGGVSSYQGNSEPPYLDSNLLSIPHSPLAIEHIIQDGGSPGIEEFAREMGADFYREGILVFGPSRAPDDSVVVDPESTLNLQESGIRNSESSRYRLIIHSEPDNGMYDAINKGIARMSGDLWAWLNCDEQYLPGTLRYAAEWFATHPETDILCGDALLTDRQGMAISYRRIVAPNWHHTRLVHLASLSCASFYRRSVVARGGIFDTRWRSIGDAEWMARLMKAGLKIEACGRLLSMFAFTGQNTSESPLASQEGVCWREAPDAPPEWMRKPTTFHHRLRKILAGAYWARSLDYAIHTSGFLGRVNRHAENLGWGWPVVGDTQMSEVSELNSEASCREAHQLRNNPAIQQSAIISVLGSALSVTTYAELSSKLIEYVDKREGVLAVDFANTHVITLRRHDSTFAALTKCIDLTVPDGMPLVWVMNTKGANLKDRVYGPTFTRKFLEGCPGGLTHYLVGGSEECGEKFRERMLELNSSLKFVGSYHGRCAVNGLLEDDEAVLKEIREKRPDFIWIGLGTPKQYAWMQRIKSQLDHGVLLAVGFAFDVNAGTKSDTPEWMQHLGLGWLHRMLSEPRRLIGRYVKYNSLFLWYLIREWMKGEVGKKLKDGESR